MPNLPAISLVILAAVVPAWADLAKPPARTHQQDLAGSWQGILYQPGGIINRFWFALNFQVQGGAVTGFSRIETPLPPSFAMLHYGTMSVEGAITALGISFHETGILHDRPHSDTYWCLKQARNLTYDGPSETLSGAWNGCFPPGTVLLRRIKASEELKVPGAFGRANLNPILFEADQDTLNTEALAALEETTAYAKRNPGSRIWILGHCDQHEAGGGHRALSQRRAKAVAAALQRNKIPGNRMKIQACGSFYPLVAKDAPEGQSANRRVEVLAF